MMLYYRILFLYFQTILSMVGHSLQDVSAAGVVACGLNYISDVEFSVLYDYSCLKNYIPLQEILRV